MSRHEVPAKRPDHKVIVGWDHPLLTFFAIVYDRNRICTDAEVIFWSGTIPREMYDVEDLRKRVAPYASLSNEIQATLYGDKDEGR